MQLLTPCTTGNGWLRVRNSGVYALCLFDKHTGEGVRVRLDPAKLDEFPHTRCWLMKSASKPDQDSEALRREIRRHGPEMLTVSKVTVRPEVVRKRNKGDIAICSVCGDAYPSAHGGRLPQLRGVIRHTPAEKVKKGWSRSRTPFPRCPWSRA